MSKFRDYLAANERRYSYRVKTIVELDDEAMDKIERAIVKYLPLDIGRVEKTIFQRNPLDFPGVENAEVFYVDITTGLPASSYILQQDLRYVLNIPEKFIVVRAPNEPTEVETQRINAVADIEVEASQKGLRPEALLNVSLEYPEGRTVDSKNFYGTEYNHNFLAYLKQLEDERELEVQAANAYKPFEWLRNDLSPEQDEADYNAGIEGAPKTPAKRGWRPQSVNAEDTPVPTGNLDDNEKVYKKVYKTKDGKTQVVSKTGVAVKKGK
jgi:hypothetical protein